eukprot:CAMPEP_0117421350 /NCGR_PEP_ID=MMETSP0758-20121206/2472_1 /TAXON_ID=63605 /ORGANISM="Percolomonas cosmopolitus, Strain AE-1 (ATCC 50343)" /LENGTH=458 /DNA_ID=CAMNT_0005203447 /DNA_START=2678 /DNA_END=4052 /DNA_ORIENTATION=+
MNEKHICQSIHYDPKQQRVTIEFDKNIENDGKLFLKGSGKIIESMDGFYRSNYTNAKGESKWMASTQFQSCAARKAFPCFDEPALKSTFQLAFEVNDGVHVLSNMMEHEDDTFYVPHRKRYVFESTPRMSTYLLAFAVSDEFEMSHTTTKDGYPIRGITVVVNMRNQYAMEVASKSIPLFERLFQQANGVPKMDILVIPDFAAGAMENYGLMTFNSQCSLINTSNPDMINVDHKELVAIVVAHELSHMYVGNLVTMKWWNDLFLNESFASYLERWAVNELHPEFNTYDEFMRSSFMVAMKLDGTHAIEVDVFDHNDVDEIYNHITYCKGASVIRMLIHYVGEEVIHKVLAAYIQKFLYQNTTAKDMWEMMEQVTGNQQIASMMQNWTQQVGYPVIFSSLSDNNQLVLKQERFGDPQSLQRWQIPLSYISHENPTTPKFVLFDEQSMTLPIDFSSEQAW